MIKPNHIVVVLLCAAGFLLPACRKKTPEHKPVEVATESKDAKTVFLDVAKALKAVEHPATGKGSAVVRIDDDNETDEKIIEFMFKANMSRSDSFSYLDGRRGQRGIVWAVGRKNTVVYNGKYVSVLTKPPTQYRYKIGYDFHPDTFLHYYQSAQTFAEYLERVANDPDPSVHISTKLDRNGLLQLISENRNENVHQYQIISVDTSNRYRPVSMLNVMDRIGKPDSSHTDNLRIDWEQYDSTWYIKTVEWTTTPGAFFPPDEPPAGKVRKKTVTVTKFHPNVEISDSEFTAQGLQTPEGTRVIDRTTAQPRTDRDIRLRPKRRTPERKTTEPATEK